MKVRFFKSFVKKKNSTKIPAESTEYTEVEAYFKDSTSIDKPTLVIGDSVELTYNYVYIPRVSRYYFIDDIVLQKNNIAEYHCSTDYLGTYRPIILTTQANVLYANGSTKNIVDKRIPTTGGVTVSTVDQAINNLTIGGAGYAGSIILGLTGKGSFGTYLMENSTLVSDLLDGVDDWWDSSVTGLLTACKQLMYGGSASECLKSAIALPIALGSADVGSGTAEALYLGNYPCMVDGTTSIKGTKITKPLIVTATDISIPWQYSDWRRNAPYTEVFLYLPFIGTITLPTNDIVNESAITVQYSINVTSGDVSVSYRGKDSSRIIGTSSGNIAMTTAYGSTGIDTSKLTSSVATGAAALAGGVATIATGGAAAPAALSITGGMAMAAGGTLSALGGSGYGSGGLGGGSTQGLDRVMHCYTVSRTLTDTQDNLNNVMGKPYMAYAMINTFSGFVMTEGFTLDGTGFGNDKDIVNRMMDSGVYIE